jgi:ankyrin repeat protein
MKHKISILLITYFFCFGIAQCMEKSIDKARQQALNDDLVEIAYLGTPSEIEAALKVGADINATSSKTYMLTSVSPIIAAILANRAPIVKLLLERGAQIPKRDDFSIISSATDPAIVTLLLAAGLNPLPNRLSPFSSTLEFDIAKLQQFDPEILRLRLLYGGNFSDEYYVNDLIKQDWPNKTWREILSSYFYKKTAPERWVTEVVDLFKATIPQILIQAIIVGDINKVKKLLTKNKEVVRDNSEISALAYAAGQANKEILSLLCNVPAYQHDSTGIEQAIEVVVSRLRGLEPDTIEYKKYYRIFKSLVKQLSQAQEQQLEVFLRGAVQQNPTLAGVIMPPEILQQIMKEMIGNLMQTSGSGK